MEGSATTFHEYEGMTMIPEFPAESLDKIKKTSLDDTDILVATYPKCGTTWMQQIVLLIQNDGENVTKAQHTYWQFIEAAFPGGKSAHDTWVSLPPPRLVKTHLSPYFFQNTLDKSKTKIFVVLRNPKDALVSYFHFYKMNEVFHFNGTWDDFFQLFKEKKIVHGDVFDVQLNWWKLRNDPRVEVFTFEDMLNDPENAVRRVMKHMGKSLSDEVVKKVVHETSFKSMKENPLTNYSGLPSMNQEISAFMRKGKVGDWKNFFSKEQAEYVNKLSAQVFEPEGLNMVDE